MWYPGGDIVVIEVIGSNDRTTKHSKIEDRNGD